LGFLDRLDEIFPGYGAVADALRGGVSEADYERLRSDDRVYALPPGAIASEAIVDIGGRQASFGLAPEWKARSEAELTQMQSGEDAGLRVHAQLFRPDAPPEVPHTLTVLSGAFEAKTTFRPVVCALAAEQRLGLIAVSRIIRVRLGGDIGHMWYLTGPVEGLRLSRPNQATIPIYSIELWVPLYAPRPRLLEILLVVPPEKINDSLPALNTLVGSWRWI